MKPHKTRGWLNPRGTPEEIAQGCTRICEAYLAAPQKWAEADVKTLSVDEKTGIQARERTAPDLPMQQGKIRCQEFEYIRHGTQCLTANWDVAEGGIICPSIGSNRTEKDFLAHIRQTVESDGRVKQWAFVCDQLNTHQSASLVRWVASLLEETMDLGEKGKSGILKNKETRAAFLADNQHPVYFIYTPKHCSWLNQIEIWFSILSRRLLRRGNFTSTQDLKEQILRFIGYFNRTMAKPFNWTYNGKPLSN